MNKLELTVKTQFLVMLFTADRPYILLSQSQLGGDGDVLTFSTLLYFHPLFAVILLISLPEITLYGY